MALFVLYFTHFMHNQSATLVICLCSMFEMHKFSIGLLLVQSDSENIIQTPVACVPLVKRFRIESIRHDWNVSDRCICTVYIRDWLCVDYFSCATCHKSAQTTQKWMKNARWISTAHVCWSLSRSFVSFEVSEQENDWSLSNCRAKCFIGLGWHQISRKTTKW